MSTVEIEALQDARRASDLANEGEREEERQYQLGLKLNAACQAIRECDLDADAVRQILATLTCRMVARGFCAADVELLETAGECVG